MPDETPIQSRDCDATKTMGSASDQITRFLTFDFGKLFDEWAKRQILSLSSHGARADCEELCRYGCTPPVLAILIGWLRINSVVRHLLVDSSTIRQTQSQTLIEAASITTNFFSRLHGGVDPNSGPKQHFQTYTESELHFVSRFVVFPETFADATGATLIDLSKYLLSAYVVSATGKYRDRNVSGILAELIGPANYPETTHCVWRSRKFPQLHETFSDLAAILCAVDGTEICES